MGSGVVGFNITPHDVMFADSNPHLINFYNALASGAINGFTVRDFLEREGEMLSKYGKDYYYEVRVRFNTPLGHKPDRFSKAYVTKIVNQIDSIYVLLKRSSNWSFVCQDFRETLKGISEGDFIYCDPPYVGRHVDYFDSWDEENERQLFTMLSQAPCKFILSTWHSNPHRKDVFLETLWSQFNMLTKEHFYYIGAKEENRKPMLEALVMNFTPRC